MGEYIRSWDLWRARGGVYPLVAAEFCGLDRELHPVDLDRQTFFWTKNNLIHLCYAYVHGFLNIERLPPCCYGIFYGASSISETFHTDSPDASFA